MSKSDPGWKKGEKGCQKGGQKGPKRHQKRDQNDSKILIDFWTDFGPNLEATWGPRGGKIRLVGRLCGMREAWLDSLSSKNSKTISILIWTRSDPSGGGGLTCPKGLTAARPLFFFCDLGQGLVVLSISAISTI